MGPAPERERTRSPWNIEFAADSHRRRSTWYLTVKQLRGRELAAKAESRVSRVPQPGGGLAFEAIARRTARPPDAVDDFDAGLLVGILVGRAISAATDVNRR